MKEPLLGLFYQKHKITLFLLLIPLFLNAQKIKVIDFDNMALVGVQIYNDDRKITGLSDENGFFNIKDSVSYLTFSLIGYKKKRLSVLEIIKNKMVVRLFSDEQLLQEVIIVGRNEQYLEDLISETDIISQREIQVTNSQSTADVLAMSGNVFVQKSQFGGGSPVLRGFEANKVLLVLDGVRMNNAIYRNGHLQNSITVDNFSLKRMEVVFGPGSLTYGSDAIGGVIHFKTKDPVFNIKFIDYKLRYSTAASEKTGFVGLNFGVKRFAIMATMSYSDFGDLKAGDIRPEKYKDFGKRNSFVTTVKGEDFIKQNSDYNVQKGTGYSQINFLSKSIYKFNKYTKLTGNFQYSTSSNVPRYDFLTEKNKGFYKYAEWYYGPQTRYLGSLRLDMSNVTSIYDNAVFIAALQKINEDRIYRKFQNEWKNYNIERLWVFSFSSDFKKYLNHNKNHELVYGLDFQNNNLNSSANRKNIISGKTDSDILSRYPSKLAQNYRFGGYIQYVFGEKDYPYQINLGTRIETNNISVKYNKNSIVEWPQDYYMGLNNNNTSYAVSLGAKYKLLYKWKISGNISTAFRNPNIDDLAKIRVKKGEMLVPNLDLTTENSYNGELSINKIIEFGKLKIKLRTTGFYTILNNAIVRKDYFLPSGSAIYIDGNDTLKVIANQNVEKEKVYGISSGLKCKFKNFTLSSNLVYTNGDIYENDIITSSAPHIPPLFGNIKIGYSYNKIRINFITIYNAKKPIELYGGSVDNPEQATPQGTYAWSIYNLYFNYNFNKYFNINLGIENIFDRHYRSFSSGVSGAGRNIIISVSGRI